ncbi:MAG: SDR family oxidoreductase [Chitinophagales bacterium]
MKKVVLVTGCKGGIGAAICNKFIHAGWQVIGTDINEEGECDFDFIHLDLQKHNQIKALVHHIKEKYSRLDCIINNAASQICKSISNTSFDDWDNVMDINLKAPYFLIKYCRPLLKATQGNIVNISSIHSIATSKKMSVYAISKSGLSQLTRSLAIDFAEDNIRVNAILPGAILTDMLIAGLSRDQSSGAPKKLKELADKTVLKRIGKPDEIAEATYFLADNNASSFITGLSLVVDGGATIKLSTE